MGAGTDTPTAVRPRLVPLPESGTVPAERFVIEAVLGKGGTGVVSVASDRRLNQRVAIKLVHPDHRLWPPGYDLDKHHFTRKDGDGGQHADDRDAW